LSRFGSNLLTSRATARIFQRLPHAHDRIAMQQNSTLTVHNTDTQLSGAKSDATLVFDKQ